MRKSSMIAETMNPESVIMGALPGTGLLMFGFVMGTLGVWPSQNCIAGT
jgi:hypothetical protein